MSSSRSQEELKKQNEMPDEIYVEHSADEWVNGKYVPLYEGGEQWDGGKTKYIRADKAGPVGDVDLDNAREVFEKWITANGDYPHLKHKSFGGNYLHEEVAMKWDGFRAGYYTQPKQSAPVAMGNLSHGCTGYKPEGDNIG